MKESYKSDKPCVVCGLQDQNRVCYHHLLTKKAHPELRSDSRLLISVCQNHHNMFHNKGTLYMADNYSGVRSFLEANNWYKCELTNKWRLNTLHDE